VQLSGAANAQATRGPGDKWNTFTATVSVRRGRVDDDGNAIGDRTAVARYQVERTQSQGRWRSTLRVLSSGRPDVVAPSGAALSIPSDIVRIEDDGDGSGVRLIGRDGRVMSPPTVKDRDRFGEPDDVFASTDALLRKGADTATGRMRGDDKDWLDAVMPARLRGEGRRLALQRRFGAPAGKVHGLDRFVETAADRTTELLADPDWAVPVEINVVRNGQLQSHAQFSYDAGPTGTLIRRGAHVEQRLSTDVRAVVDVELSGVRLEDRR
jgi:hypothetical protein